MNQNVILKYRNIRVKNRAGEPEPVGAGHFWLLGAGADWKKKRGAGAGAGAGAGKN